MSDLTPEPVDNVIGMNQEISSELEITLKARTAGHECYDQHKSVIVCVESRTLTCQHCGFVVDPWDYIFRWGREGDRRMSRLKDLDHKIRVCTAELSDLHRQITSVRGQLRRSGSPQTSANKDMYNMQRWNPGRMEIIK